MRYLAGIFALLTAATGWYYLFYSRAAHGLAEIEAQRLNERRVALRRVGGVVMLLLGGFLYAGFVALEEEPERSPGAFVAVWTTVFALLIAVIVLAMIDLRLTHRLRARQKGARS